jgi:glycosyltransferase involved in cell wall biosynthesis
VKNELIERSFIKNNQLKNPEISIIITVFNQEKCFYKALRSVQNQSLKNIEIILVDDCSTDNSLEIMENYQKNDDRIILLKNPYNYGKIKSRSNAVKLAKGKYILVIDGDDGLAKRDILYNSLNIAKIGNLDVIEFKMAYFINRNYKRIENNLEPIDNLYKKIIYQPELKYKFIKITKKEKLWNYLNRSICSKLIKNDIFKKVLEFIGPKYTQDNLIIFEDTIMSSSLFILSNSYYLMNEPGYYRSKKECIESINKKDEKKFSYNNCMINNNYELDPVKYLNFLLDKLNSSRIVGELIYSELLTIDYHFDLCKRINNEFGYVYKILERILNHFSFFTNEQKSRIINLKNRFIQKEKKLINDSIFRKIL